VSDSAFSSQFSALVRAARFLVKYARFHPFPTHEDPIMAATLTVRDETTAGQTLHEFALEVLTERLTVRELIRSRVYQEVQDYNRRQPAQFRGLVQPTDADASTNSGTPWPWQASHAASSG
jgi:hypothetical protein